MLRNDIIYAIDSVTNFFENSKLSGLLTDFASMMRTNEKIHDAAAVLEAYNEVRRYYDEASASERDILAKFNLGNIHEAEHWAFFLAPKDRFPSVLMEWHSALYYLTKYLPQMKTLLVSDEMTKVAASDNDMLTVFIDEGTNPLEVATFVDALSAVANLYGACLSLFGLDQSHPLYLVRIDSGSKKLFSVSGAAKVIRKIKETLVEVSQRMFFLDAKEMEANCKAAIAGCELIKEIAKLEKAGTITPAVAEKSKKAITKNFTRLFEANAYTGEMKAVGLEKKKISSPTQRLLEYKAESIDE